MDGESLGMDLPFIPRVFPILTSSTWYILFVYVVRIPKIVRFTNLHIYWSSRLWLENLIWNHANKNNTVRTFYFHKINQNLRESISMYIWHEKDDTCIRVMVRVIVLRAGGRVFLRFSEEIPFMMPETGWRGWGRVCVVAPEKLRYLMWKIPSYMKKRSVFKILNFLFYSETKGSKVYIIWLKLYFLSFQF